jgi:hypothetical protein
MDRRDALKKLGMGGATVVGATMIVSSPALASTVNAVTPTVTVTTSTNERVAEFTMAQSNPTCGGSPIVPPSRVSTFTAGPASNGAFSPLSGSVALTPALATTLTVPNPGKFVAGNSATITIQTRFTCQFSAGPTNLCQDYTFLFQYDEVAKNFTTSGPATSTC